MIVRKLTVEVHVSDSTPENIRRDLISHLHFQRLVVDDVSVPRDVVPEPYYASSFVDIKVRDVKIGDKAPRVYTLRGEDNDEIPTTS